MYLFDEIPRPQGGGARLTPDLPSAEHAQSARAKRLIVNTDRGIPLRRLRAEVFNSTLNSRAGRLAELTTPLEAPFKPPPTQSWMLRTEVTVLVQGSPGHLSMTGRSKGAECMNGVSLTFEPGE